MTITTELQKTDALVQIKPTEIAAVIREYSTGVVGEIRFTRRHRQKILEFAELATADAKLKYLARYENFNGDFQKTYGKYHHYLKISIEREKLLKVVTERVEEMRKIMAETETDKAFKSYYKRIYRIHRRLVRKLRYRLRPNYFDNTLVNRWIQLYNETSDPVFVDLIAHQVDLIIIRQVKRFKLYQFSMEMEDLLQEIRHACLTALNKFDITKGKAGREAFNYFSLICRKAGVMVTLRHSARAKQETANSDVVAETLGDVPYSRRDEHIYVDPSANDKLSSFYEYFHQLFERKERMQLLLQILVYYILNVSYFSFKKNEFVKYACSYGFTPAFVNKFLNIMKSTRGKFEKDTDFDF